MAARDLQKPKKRTHKILPPRGLLNWAGWLEYVNAFQHYVCEPYDIEPLYVEAYSYTYQSTQLHCLDVDGDELLNRRLYVLESSDLLDFSGEDVVLAWNHRGATCGSPEAAAELFALYRVMTDLDEFYQSAERFLQHPDILAIFDPGFSPHTDKTASREGSSECGLVVLAAPTLFLEDVRKLSSSELMQAWEGRPDSFASLEAAAEAFSTLRWFSSADPEKQSLNHYLKHSLILELEAFLPRELLLPSVPSPERELDLLKQDRRETRVQVSVVRTGQRDFRGQILQRYGRACCVTGCAIERLLEAAHVISFRGSQTDEADNGLLFRVDIHRLFDEHLVSIDPIKFEFLVSKSITDASYRGLHGARLFRMTPKPRKLYLEDHFRRFQREERKRQARS